MSNLFYKIGEDNGAAFILCLVCKRKSFHLMDIKHKFCAHCRQFHEIRELVERMRQEGTT